MASFLRGSSSTEKRLYKNNRVSHVLWGRNDGFLEIENEFEE
jgi:hypothetical protein